MRQGHTGSGRPRRAQRVRLYSADVHATRSAKAARRGPAMSAVSYRYEALLVPATLAGDEIRQALEAGFVQRLRFQAASAGQAQLRDRKSVV